MKTYFKHLLLFLCLYFAHLDGKCQAPINVNLVYDSISVCKENGFEATVIGTDTTRITIHYSLDFNGNLINSCDDNSGANHQQVVLIVDSSSFAYSNVIHDTINGTWTATFPFSGNDTCRLYYKILIDCSVIPDTSTATLELEQVWIDSLTSDTLSLNNNPILSLPVYKPYILAIIPAGFKAAYLETIPLQFLYKNTGNTEADVIVNFLPDTNEYCHQLPQDSLTYQIGLSGSRVSFIAQDDLAVLLDPGDTLIITQFVLNTSCVICDTTTCDCNRQVKMNWKCNNILANSGVFCDTCVNFIESNYRIISADSTKLVSRRNLPSDVNFYDNTCLNDTNGVQWEYVVLNEKGETLDSVIISLEYNPDELISQLTLIPNSSVSFTPYCNQCTISEITVLRDSALCTNLVPDALKSRQYIVRRFMENDSIVFRFRTMNCGENDTALINQAKFFNHWSFGASGRSICGNVSGDLTPPKISLYSGSGDGNLNQVIVHFPNVTDMSIPPGETFGDSTIFNIDCNEIVSSVNDLQIFGYNTQQLTAFNGWLSAKIHCEQGLRVSEPEKDVYFLNLFNGIPDTIYPVYYHDSVPDDQCLKGDFYFYFRLDTTMYKTLNNGKFMFELQACCGVPQNPPFTDYNVVFHVLPNGTDTCYTLDFSDTTHLSFPGCTGVNCSTAWIPLSMTGSRIATHCPGCAAPGIIVDNYKMRRKTFGFQDSDNDAIADAGFIPIVEGNSWFTGYENLLDLNQSSLGDIIEDKLWAHFQPGDSSSGGYTYVQMYNLPTNIRLPYLQLLRTIPAGIDTMNLQIQEFTLYIDTLGTAGSCIDCNEFQIPSQYKTMLAIHVSQAGISNYVDIDAPNNRWLFTFEAPPVANGNLGDSIIYSDTSLPFTGFYESQRYRLKVTYSACGNFTSSNNNVQEFNELIKRSEITNKMWLCGRKITLASVDTTKDMLNSVNLLNQVGITIYPNNVPPYSIMDTAYSNSRLFYCEIFGGLHYFLSQNAKYFSGISNLPGCNYQISAITRTERGGYEQFQRSYPYEFRPPALTVDSLVFNVPTGMYIKQASIQHQCFVYDFGINAPRWKSTNFVPIQLSDTIGKVVVYNTQLPQGVCLDDSSVFPVSVGDTNLYVTSGLNHREIYFTLAPLTCADSGFVVNDTSLVAHFSNYQPTCTDSILCGETFSIVRNAFPIAGIANNYHIPNLIVQTTVDTIDLFQNTFCIDLTYTNPTRIINGITVAEDAGFVYIQLPTNPAFTNWQLIQGVDTIQPVNGVIHVDSSFANNAAVIYSLCARVNSCDTLPTIEIKTGWNCEGFPIDALDTNTCGKFTFPVSFKQSTTALANSGKSPQNATIALCDTIFASAIFQNSGQGHLTPAYVELTGNNIGLELLGVWISNSCMLTASAPDSIQLSYDSLTQTWPISTADLLAINYNNYLSDSAISAGECISINAHFRPGCDYQSSRNDLPDINLYTISYCGDTISSEASYSSAIVISGNQCTNCFTVTKTASQNPVPAGDTLTFNIIITGNNGSTQSVWVSEIYPSDFTVLNSSLPSGYVIPAQGSDTITVTGYFNTVGPCDDPTHINTVVVSGNLYLDSASVCVEVSNPCINDSTIIFRNDSSASNYGSAFVNRHIYIAGTFYVDQDISFEGCIVEAAAGASIQLLGSNQLNAFNTTFSGCDTMWQGMLIRDRGTISFESNVVLRDAQTGIDLGQNGNASINQSIFENNVTGIYNPEVYPSIFGGSLLLNGVTFDMTSSGFRTSYQGQPAHGVIPFAGVFLNDAYLDIGRDDHAINKFNNMNNGVRAFRSEIAVRNCSFSNIQLTSFYHTGGNENGSAISVQGDLEISGLPSGLKVFPVPGGINNVVSSRTGIYASYTAVGISGCKMDSMRFGIEVNQATAGIFSTIIANTIKATDYGINLYDNNGGDQIVVEDNLININGSKIGIGIGAAEFVRTPTNTYSINNNTVQIINAGAGIQVSGVRNSLVSNNRITIDKGINSAPVTSGMNITAGGDNTISCNSVVGKGYQLTMSDTLRYGYRIAQSNNNILQCNSSDSTGFSFRFEGAANLNTSFKGNHMGNAWCGLYLNSEANIGLQPVLGLGALYHGNIWLDSMRYSSGFGAASLNDFPPQNLQFSLFTTNSTNNYHNPLIPTDSTLGPFFVNDLGWFSPQFSGNSFNCIQSQTCNSAVAGGGDDEQFRQMVIQDSAVSTVFIPESKLIANQLVYADLLLEKDSLLPDYLQYVSEKGVESVGLLHVVNENIYNNYSNDSSFLVSNQLANEQAQSVKDSIQLIDSLYFETLDSNLITIKNNLISDFYSIRTQLSSTLSSKQQSVNSTNGQIVQANIGIIGEQAPDNNEQYLNYLYLSYKQIGRSVLINEYPNILSIAQQCPSAGGEAVFRARNIIRNVNDSIIYDDAGVCAQMGIYRKKQNSINQDPVRSFVLIPNPAHHQTQLVFNQPPTSNYTIQIINNEGKVVENRLINHHLSSLILNTELLSNGLFTVNVIKTNGEFESEKLVIIK